MSSNEMIEQWGKFSRATLGSLKELTAINVKLGERLAEQQLELVGLTFETGLEGVNRAVAAPGYKELVASEAKLAGEYDERVLGIVRKTSDIVAAARDEYAEWAEGRFKEVATPISRAARKSAA
jgi:phasin family protein